MSLSLLHQKETILIELVGWIPKKPGIILRNWLYRYLFARMGNSIRIESAVEFTQPRYLEIGSKVNIARHAYISTAPLNKTEVGNNRIYLEDGVKIGCDVHIKCHGRNSTIYLRKKAILDRGVDIRSLDNGLIDIGQGTYIGPYVCIAGPGPIKIGNNCLIASQSGIYGNNHRYNDPNRTIFEQGIICQGITIEDDCWLGSGVKVLDGVTIRQGSVIGAGAVVTKNIPAYSIAMGVPAQVISKRINTLLEPI
ncbi:DapH/DapD/GlmU-related protein [Chroococcus sp. FPU101]|uniref:DapH/DapD/GlmU-related protein n=1 Tax=Chroococcus sp. FPU101 TaxID=1974212 RepID=UPI001AA43563|nr:DapH/DapD/GlmU-related protein [Chroococcus sp. FPU101]GFE69588.1 hexapaptide repeat-containing transferase [Chroococcus sp. FPU101]